MREPGRSRETLAAALGAAFAEGLLSERTLSHRLERLYAPGLVDPLGLIGDLPRGYGSPSPRLRSAVARTVGASRSLWHRLLAPERPPALVLALDSVPPVGALTLGRAPGCDVVIRELTVSRRHALLRLRDGGWVVQDLASRNGLTVNGEPVGRSAVGPGDVLGLGLAHVELD